jgi:acetyl-CoA synthetase
MLRGIYGDPQRYKATYWSRFPGKYFAGDGAKRDEEGYFWLLGRVDDVMNVSGHRISTIEVESALVDHKAVAEAAVVGRHDPITGQAIFAFVILRLGYEPNDELAAEVREHVGKVIGPIAKPKYLLFTPDLPKTRSGKIMRRLLRDIGEGRALGDTTTLADAAVVEAIRDRSAADGPRTIAARALLTRPGDRTTMRGVMTTEISKLLVRIEEEAAAPYRAELEWALDHLADDATVDPARVARARALLERG